MSDADPALAVSGAASPATRLRSDGVFRLYWTAHTTSSAGSAVTLVVLPILMYQRTGSAFLTASLGAVYIAPYVLLGAVIGTVADRVDRRRLMVSCDLASAVTLASIPAASALGVLTTAQIFVATVVAGVLLVGFDSAQFGALPQLFGRQHLVAAMSSLAAVDTILTMAGTAAGGVLATTLGPAPSVWLDSASFAGSALLLSLIRRPFRDPSTAGPRRRAHFRHDVAEGVRFLFGHRVLRALTLAGTAASLTGGSVTGLLVVYGVRRLRLTDHDVRLGLLYTAGAAGTLVATVLIPRLTSRFQIPALNLATRTASLALVVLLALLRDFAAALVVYAAFAVAETLAIRSAIAFRQLVTPDHMQGRVNALGRMTAIAGQPVGAALGGVVADALGVQAALLVLSAGLLASTVSGWAGPLRPRARPAGRPAAGPP